MIVQISGAPGVIHFSKRDRILGKGAIASTQTKSVFKEGSL
ncbi:hypothetical protein [Trichocoleus sp. DQ-A2]